MGECVTITVWGGLGREGSRGLQQLLATWHLVFNTSYISWIQANNYTSIQQLGLNVYSENLVSFCDFITICGVASYILAVGQIFIKDI